VARIPCIEKCIKFIYRKNDKTTGEVKMEIQIKMTKVSSESKKWTLRLSYLLLMLLGNTGYPTISVAASTGFQTAKTGLFFGGSTLTACGGSLLPLQSFLGVQGVQFKSTQLTGDVFSKTVLPSQIPYDFVSLSNREEGWKQLGYAANLSYAASLHQQIVGQGSRTALWMTYLVGYGPTVDLTYRSKITQYWKRLETDLENITIGGSKRDVLLIPVLELWELGRAKYPYDVNAASCSYLRGFQTDRLHASNFGQYATGILMATFLSCKDPRLVNDTAPYPASYKQWARDTAWTLFNSSYKPDHCL
jgi:hypothetical protein